MTALRVLTVESAPRDTAGLCQWSAYSLLKFAGEIGMLADPSSEAAFAHLSRSERAEQIVPWLKAYDAKNGAPAGQAVAPPPPPAQPAAPPAGAPVAPGGQPAPAVTGRKPRNTAPAAGAPKAPGAPVGTPATPPQQPQAGGTVGMDQALGMIASMKDELAVVKGNTEGLGKNVIDVAKQLELFNKQFSAILWMLGQIAEGALGADAQSFQDDAFKATGKG